jgi:hypothetical protein
LDRCSNANFLIQITIILLTFPKESKRGEQDIYKDFVIPATDIEFNIFSYTLALHSKSKLNIQKGYE